MRCFVANWVRTGFVIVLELQSIGLELQLNTIAITFKLCLKELLFDL